MDTHQYHLLWKNNIFFVTDTDEKKLEFWPRDILKWDMWACNTCLCIFSNSEIQSWSMNTGQLAESKYWFINHYLGWLFLNALMFLL